MSDLDDSEQPGAGGNRRALVMAAYARIASNGFEGLRTRDIAADAGVNIGTLHYYFPSKEALIRATVRHSMAKFAATLSPSGSPTEQLRRHLRAVRHLLKTDQELWTVMSEIAVRSARDDVIGEVIRNGDDQWYSFMHGLLERCVAEGALNPSLRPDTAAAAVIAAIRGISMPALGRFRPERIDQTFDQLEQWLGLADIPPNQPREG